jgi:hypothetical protein
MHIYININIYIHTHTHTHTHTHHTHTHEYIHTYTYIYIYIHTYKHNRDARAVRAQDDYVVCLVQLTTTITETHVPSGRKTATPNLVDDNDKISLKVTSGFSVSVGLV